MTKTACLFVDFINDIVDPKGKLAGKGYATFDQSYGALDKAATLLKNARDNHMMVVHVAVGFSPDYKEQPKQSPLFGAAQKFGALTLGAWGTKFHEKVAPIDGEAVMIKHRVSPFWGTSLDSLLRTNGVERVLIAGCATDMAVQASARDAHDRDYAVTVVGDCCIAANDEDHQQTLRMLSKIAQISCLADEKGIKAA